MFKRLLLAGATLCALAGSVQAQTYPPAFPQVKGPSGSYVAPTIVASIGVDSVSGAWCLVGVTTTCSGGASLGSVSLSAGSAFVGQFGGQDTVVTTTPTIQNATYASGNCMGGFQAVSVARVAGGSGILNYVNLISSGGATTALQVYVFDQSPSSSTCNDKSTFSIAAADQPKLVTTFALTPSAPTGSTWTEAEQDVMAKSFTTSGNADLYVAIVSAGAWTPASTSDLKVVIGASLN